MAQHTKYAYEKPEEMVQVSSNRHDTSRTGTKNPQETARSPNERNRYNQEPHRTDKNRLFTDASTTGEPVKSIY